MGSNTSSRNIGIDFLRVVSMAMVVVLHVLGQGGILASAKFISVNYCIAWFFEIAAYCAVNCYALISGYVGIRSKKHKFSSIAALWLQVALYSVVITVIMHFTHGVSSLFGIFKSLFPVATRAYWYFTAYFAMWFFMPLMNSAIDNLPKNQAATCIVAAGLVLIPVSLTTDAFDLSGGYGVIWISYLYLIGAYIGKYEPFRNISQKCCFLVYLACILVVFCYKIGAGVIWGGGSLLVNYVSPFILIAAIALLVLFSKMNVSTRFAKIISFVSPLSFSVYLIHTHPLIFSHVLRDRFQYIANANSFALIGFLLLAVVVIFVICAAIDYIRALLFELFKVRKALSFIEERITAFVAKTVKKLRSSK